MATDNSVMKRILLMIAPLYTLVTILVILPGWSHSLDHNSDKQQANFRQEPARTPTPVAPTSQDKNQEKKPTFKLLVIADTSNPEYSGSGYAKGYQAQDGEHVDISRTFFKSASVVATVLERTLKNATKIIERKPVSDETGKAVGERIVATLVSETTHDQVFVIFFTKDTMFEQIISKSLKDAQDFEITLVRPPPKSR